MNDKKLYGQFFTITNPFNIDVFYKWMSMIPAEKKQLILEPFAGENNIVEMIKALGFTSDWKCYDINPTGQNKTPEYKIIQQDTIRNFPQGYSVAITNPPYLAKNSATRMKLDFPESTYDDMYKIALEEMLNSLDYVAAIIPESFASSNLFHKRLYSIISLTCKMFNDTDCPVCLALFIPTKQKKNIDLDETDFYIYNQNTKIGQYKALSDKIPKTNAKIAWKFNDPNGAIGINCIDNTISHSICFLRGEEIPSSKIKVSSRSLTRVSGLPTDINCSKFLTLCNKKLLQYREDTSDIFLTSFKGLRKDGRYRRRLDFANARIIMNYIVEEIRQG